jgi:ketosteroid isomerase-like protein
MGRDAAARTSVEAAFFWADVLRCCPVTSTTETAVLAANRSFYDAFTQHNADAMAHVWAREHVVQCIHPGRSTLHGRDAVLASFRAILESSEAPKISFTDVAGVVLGEVAFVTCIEHIGEAKLAATNIFTFERGEWRMVHHHAGLVASTSEGRRPPASPLN